MRQIKRFAHLLLKMCFLYLYTSCLNPSLQKHNSKLEGTNIIDGGIISIEDNPDGKGSVPDLSTVYSGDSLTLFAVIRNTKGKLLSKNTAVNWSIDTAVGTITSAASGTQVSVLFTGDGTLTSTPNYDAGFITATYSGLTSGQVTVNTYAGSTSQIFIEDAFDGTGNIAGDYAKRAGETETFYAIGRDQYLNFVSLETVNWSVSPVTTGSLSAAAGTSTVFTSTKITTSGSEAVITADHATAADDTTGGITITSGTATIGYIETAPDGTGLEIFDKSMVSNEQLTLYFVTRDAYGNFIGTDNVNWSVPSNLGVFSNSSSYTTIFTASVAGTQVITADHASLTDDTTGNITVTNSAPVVASDQIIYVDENASTSFWIDAATDSDSGQNINYQLVSYPVHGTITDCMGESGSSSFDRFCLYNATSGFSGREIVTYQVNDEFTTSVSTASVSIFVRNNNWIWSNNVSPVNSNFVDYAGDFISAQSVPSTLNLPGGRTGSAYWTDSDGNFWLFGGDGVDSLGNSGSYLNDLWKYNPTSKEWTWAKGSQTQGQGNILSTTALGGSATDGQVTPGARQHATTWVVNNGSGDDDLYLFGGVGHAQAYATIVINDPTMDGADDLTINGVVFPVATGASVNAVAITIASAINASVDVLVDGIVSAYVATSSNTIILFADTVGVGGNALTLAETDNATDNFTLSGATFTGGTGVSFAEGSYNDLWKYNTATDTWSLVWAEFFHPTNQGSKGYFGTQGTATASTTPSSRWGAAGKWVDTASTSLYLFGGIGKDKLGFTGDYVVNGTTLMGSLLNDLWIFNYSTVQWTWSGGESLHGGRGDFGTQGSSSSTNYPSARGMSYHAVDSQGNYFLFGGLGFPDSGDYGQLNDLWKYSKSTGEWTWISGMNQADVTANYGTQLAGATSNYPSGRSAGSFMIDPYDHLFLIGGNGYDSASSLGLLNDVWMYDPSSNEWTWNKGSQTSDQLGNYGALGIELSTNNPGGREFPASWIDPLTGDLYLFGGDGFGSAGANGLLRDLWKYNP